MIARALLRRDETGIAIPFTLLGAAFLALIAIDDRFHFLGHWFDFSPGFTAYLVVSLAMLVPAIAPFLSWPSRGKAVKARVEGDAVLLDGQRIEASEVSALTIARAARGYSLAFARGKGGKTTSFLEVERVEDARALAAALGGERGEVPLRRGVRVLAIVQALLSLAIFVCTPLYFMCATDWMRFEGKALFGVSSVIFCQLALILLVFRRVAPSHAVAVYRGAYDAHVKLHVAKRAVREMESAEDVLEPETRVRVAALARGAEPVDRWIARVDALPTGDGAYRDMGLGAEALWSTLGDEEEPAESRFAAARLLARRHGATRDALAKAAKDRDMRARVAVAGAEAGAAASELESLGPVFRAR